MASVLGEMKGAAMKIGQMASFIDIDFLPPEYREIYQEQLAKLRAQRAARCRGSKVHEVLAEEYDEPTPETGVRLDRAGGLRRRLDRPGPPRDAARRQRGRGQGPVPGHRRRARVGHGQRRHPRPRSPRRSRPGLDAKAVAARAARAGARGARLRVRGAEPARLRPRLRRAPVHLRPQGPLAALAPPRAGQRVRRGPRLRGGQGAATRTSATSSARSSSASASARSTTCSTSTPTPTPATTC